MVGKHELWQVNMSDFVGPGRFALVGQKVSKRVEFTHALISVKQNLVAYVGISSGDVFGIVIRWGE